MKRKYFSFAPRTIWHQSRGSLKVLFSRFSETSSYKLYNRDEDIDKLLENTPGAKTLIRSIFFCVGDFDDEKFEWLSLGIGGVNVGSCNFSSLLHVKKGHAKELSNSALIYNGKVENEKFTIFEVISATQSELANLGTDEIDDITRRLNTIIQGEINYLLIRHKEHTGNIELQPMDDESVVFKMTWLSFEKFEKNHLMIMSQAATEFKLNYIKAKENTFELFMKYGREELSPLSEKITYNLIRAIELRFDSKFSLVPIMCHVVVENLERFLRKEFKLVRKENFKDRLREVQSLDEGNEQLSQYIELYCKYGYKLRNKPAHEGRFISVFLSDYALYLTVNLVLEIISIEAVTSLEKVKTMKFPFYEVKNFEKMTEELIQVYGENLNKFESWPS